MSNCSDIGKPESNLPKRHLEVAKNARLTRKKAKIAKKKKKVAR